MELPKLTYLRITGDISIEPLTGLIPKDPLPYLCLIMGPTGAGKSSFIEALAGESQRLFISKDQLAGYTRAVKAYHLVNVLSTGWVPPRPVHVIDTPGYSDTKISEVEIIDMIRKWLEDNDVRYVNKILFLTPITETRLTGSRRQTITMLKQLMACRNAHDSVTFVTTMWDTLHNERARIRAESNFAQLRDQDFYGEYQVSITRFINTKKSALETLDSRYDIGTNLFSSPISSASPNLYKDLHERIEGALQAKQMIDSELAQPDTQTNVELRNILEQNQRENYETLTKFIGQLINFGLPPSGFHQAAQRLRKTIATQITPEDYELMVIFQQWEQEPEILELGVPVPDPESSSSTGSLPLSSRKLALKSLLRRLLNAAKRRGSKWFKRRA